MFLSKILIIFIRIYQNTLSLLIPPSCRYHPTCSQYSIDALKKYGFFIGAYKTVVRLFKCHPLNPGGYDPIR